MLKPSDIMKKIYKFILKSDNPLSTDTILSWNDHNNTVIPFITDKWTGLTFNHTLQPGDQFKT